MRQKGVWELWGGNEWGKNGNEEKKVYFAHRTQSEQSSIKLNGGTQTLLE